MEDSTEVRMLRAIFIFVLFLTGAAARSEKPAFEQAMDSHTDYRTREQWVERDGQKFREVEHAGKKYYVKFLTPDGSRSSLSCELPKAANSQHLAEGGVQIYKRSQVFIRFLEETCDGPSGRARNVVNFDAVKIGFTIPDGKKPKITNKKITIDPLNPLGAGFEGNF
jgi:hypothetical protein